MGKLSSQNQNNRLRKIPILCCLIFWVPCIVLAQTASLGSVPGAFLRGVFGADALGKAGCVTVSPVNMCTFYNPAAVGLKNDVRACFGGGYRPLGRIEGFGDIEYALPPRAGVSFAFIYRTDPFIGKLVDEQEYPIENCHYLASFAKLGFRYLVTRKWSLGFNSTISYQQLPTDYNQTGNVTYTSQTMLAGFDIGSQYTLSKNHKFAFVVKNMMSAVHWQIALNESNLIQNCTDTLAIASVMAYQWNANLKNRPLNVSCEAVAYVFNGYFHLLPHAMGTLALGAEWAYYDNIIFRAGLKDLVVSNDIIHDFSRYIAYVSPSLTAGISFDVPKKMNSSRMRLNYALATDKVWAGIEQQLDVTFFIK